MATDALAPCIAKPSAVVLWIIVDEKHIVIYGEGFHKII